MNLRDNAVTITAVLISILCIVIWGVLGTTPDNAIRVLFIGLFFLMTILVGFLMNSYVILRNTNPVYADDSPPLLWVAVFLSSYIASLLFVTYIAIIRALQHAEIEPTLLVLATLIYLLGFVSVRKLIVFNLHRLQNKINNKDTNSLSM